MKLNIKKFENPSGNILKLNTAIDEAYDFYHNDVEARKERERSWLLQLYTIKTPIEKTSINIDNNLGIGLGTSSGDDFVGEWRYNKGIYLNPNIIFKKYYNKDRLSRAITHELSHEDAYLKRPKDYAIDEYIAPLVLENITIKEKKYLDNAYKTDANTSSKNIEEKHATNRLLRHQLYLNFIKVNGRKPNSIEELDDFIKNTSDMSIMYLLRDLNDYGNDYFYNNNTDPKAIKDALIHVALNNTGVVLYAKKGCNIKKYQTPSEPLNKNYTLPEVTIEPDKWQKEYILYFPESVRKDINYKHWLRTDDVKKRLYDVWNTYGRPKINDDKSMFNKLGIIGKKRPHVWGNAMYNVRNYPHLLAELSHFVLENRPLKWLRDLPETLDGELSGTQKHYRTPGHYEYEAHKVIEPAIKNYIEKGEVIFNLPETIITQNRL